jgi:hypothetical protein
VFSQQPEGMCDKHILAQLRGFALDFAESKKHFPYESVPGLWITHETPL